MEKVFSKTTSLNYYSISNLIIIILLIITTISCSNSDENYPPIPNEIAQEIKDLIYFKGEENAPIVLINSQGGPSTKLSTREVDIFFQGFFNTTDILMANVHQSQTLNPNILEDNDITLDRAVHFNTESVEILYKVIKYFKDQGRTVYILGVSYGAFLTQDLIVRKGINVADKYLIMNGRLDINDVMWRGLAEGKEGRFQNGVTPIIEPTPHNEVIDRNSLRINAGIGMNRYTQLFNTIDDLSKLTYVYGKTDEAIGSLTAEEVAFLASKNTNIISGPGNHTDTYNDFIIQGLKEAFGIVPQ